MTGVSIVEVIPGKKYRLVASIGTGKTRSRPHRTLKCNKTQAKKAAAEWVVELEHGIKPASKQMLADYLRLFIEDRRQDWSPRHLQDVERIVSLRIAPHFKGVRLSELTPELCRRWLSTLRNSGGKGGKALSPQTCLNAYSVLRAAMTEAVRRELIWRSPLTAVRPPRPGHSEPVTFSAAELRAIEAAAEHTPLHIAVMLAVRTGMRRGEIVGLQWRDVDLSRGILTVRHAVERIKGGNVLRTTKTGQARRVGIDAELVDALAIHRSRQAIRASDYTDDRPVWVVSHDDATMMSPDVITLAFKALLRQTGLYRPGRGLQAVRRAHETLLADAGFDRYQLGRRLGHSPRVAERHYIGRQTETEKRLAGAFLEILETSGRNMAESAESDSGRREEQR